MTGNRPSIPAELERRVKTEAGHRCAIPTCRQWPVELAHIIPYRIVKNHSFDNLIALCPTCHTRYDNAKDIDRASMYDYKARLRTAQFAQSEAQILRSSELEHDSQKEAGLLRHFPLLNEYLTNLPKREQLAFYQISIASITVFIVVMQLGVGLRVRSGNLLATLITPGTAVIVALLLLFFIRREYRCDDET